MLVFVLHYVFEAVIKLLEKDGRVILFTVGSFSMYTLVPLFLPMLEAPSTLDFWDHKQLL
jgi:hypothetical protein